MYSFLNTWKCNAKDDFIPYFPQVKIIKFDRAFQDDEYFFFVFSFDMTKMTSCYHFQWRKHPFLQLRQLDETGQMMAFHFSLTQKTPRNVTIINTRAIFLTWDTVPAMIRKGQWCHLRKWSRTSMPFFLILKTYIPTWF